MSKPTIPLRVFVPHARTCYSKRRINKVRNPWAFGLLKRERHGNTYESVLIYNHPRTGKSLRFPYIAFCCNDTECRAVGGFRARDVIDALWVGDEGRA